MRSLNCNILSGADTGSVTGGKVDTNQIFSASFAMYFGADVDAAGTLKIQASNDITNAGNVAADFTPTNWVDIPNATVTVSSSAPGLITIANMTYRWIRAVYTRSSGGSTTVNVNMCGLGY